MKYPAYDCHLAALDQVIPWLRKGMLPSSSECVRLADELGRARDTLASSKANLEGRKDPKNYGGRVVKVGAQNI